MISGIFPEKLIDTGSGADNIYTISDFANKE